MKTRRFLFLSLAFLFALTAAVVASPPFISRYVWNGSRCNLVTTLPDNCAASNTATICKVGANITYNSQQNCESHDGTAGVLRRPN